MTGRGKIEDTQATVAEPYLTVFVETVVIGASIGDQIRHPLDEV
jgi:hypothetical protein